MRSILRRAVHRNREWPPLAVMLVFITCAFAPPWRNPGDYFYTIHRGLWNVRAPLVIVALAATLLLIVTLVSSDEIRRWASWLSFVGSVAVAVLLVYAKIPLAGGMMFVVAWRSALSYLDETAYRGR